MKSAFQAAAAVVVVLGTASIAPAQAMGPVSDHRIAPTAPITSVMTDAKRRRLYMIESLQRQMMRQQGHGHNHGRGYGGGYGGGRGYDHGYGRGYGRHDRW